MLTQTETYIGPAVVTLVARERVRISLPGREEWARLALAYPYQPQRGDVVLALGGDELFVVGVLEGKGPVRLSFPGDVEISAGGDLRLRAGRGMELSGPGVVVKTDRFELIARVAFSTVLRAYLRVKEALCVQAGSARTTVDGHYTLRARGINQRADDDVRIDGRQIHLG